MISSKLYAVLSAMPREGEAVLYRQLPQGSDALLSQALEQQMITATQGLEADSRLELTQAGSGAVEEYRLLHKTARDAKSAKWLSAAAAVLAAVSLVVACLRPAASVPGQSPQVPEAAAQAQPEILPQGDFDALWTYFQDRQKQRLETPFDAAQIKALLAEDPQDANAITDQELDTLMQHHTRPNTIRADKAREDVDLLMRAFRSCYAAYYYFGEAEFENAREMILSQLPQEGELDISDFEYLVSGAFAFLRDAHAGVFPQGAGLEYRPYEDSIRQRYHYTDLYFTREEGSGYVTSIQGESWEFVSFTDQRVMMEPRLLPDGTVCYSPVLLCSRPEVTGSEVVLQSGSRQQSLGLSWTEGLPYLDYYSGDPDYKMMSQNGVVYISQRAFQARDPQVLERFAADGAEARNAKLIVFDLRSNGGGDDRYAAQWLENFRGTGPQQNFLFASRSSKLSQRMGNPTPLGSYDVFQSTGSVIPNEIPIVVLVDDRCASSGESMLNTLRNMDNVIVVGSNSAGFQLCGNVAGLTLPNSGMIAQFGTSLSFQYSPESVDFVGYQPDIWCDPRTSLDAVWNMLVKYGKITPDQIPLVPETPGGSSASADGLTLIFQDNPVFPEDGFGAPEIGPHFIDVLLNGQKIADFQLENGNPDACGCEILEDGTLKLTRTGPGGSPLTVTAQGHTATFHWFGGEEEPVPVSNCDMVLLYRDFTVCPGQGFGDPTPDLTHPLTVVLNGEVITDFQVENGNDAACSLEIDENGVIQLTRIGPGGSELTIRSGDSWATFRWFGGEV